MSLRDVEMTKSILSTVCVQRASTIERERKADVEQGVFLKKQNVESSEMQTFIKQTLKLQLQLQSSFYAPSLLLMQT